jgi:hypothetical protein
MIGRDASWMMRVLQACHGYHNAVVVFRLSYVRRIVMGRYGDPLAGGSLPLAAWREISARYAKGSIYLRY